MKLRYIHEGDFRKNEHTNYLEAVKKGRVKLGANDVIAVLNSRRTMIRFVWSAVEIDYTPKRGEVRSVNVIGSRMLRLLSGHWEPLMLANYAGEVGIKLDGLKKFQDHYKGGRYKRK